MPRLFHSFKIHVIFFILHFLHFTFYFIYIIFYRLFYSLKIYIYISITVSPINFWLYFWIIFISSYFCLWQSRVHRPGLKVFTLSAFKLEWECNSPSEEGRTLAGTSMTKGLRGGISGWYVHGSQENCDVIDSYNPELNMYIL